MAPEQQFFIENNTQIFYIGRPRYIGTTDAKVGLRKITGTPSLGEKYTLRFSGVNFNFP
jgi:hypothetical protein